MVYTVDIGNMVLEELRGGSTQKKAALSHKTATTPRNLGSPLTSKHTHKTDPSDHNLYKQGLLFLRFAKYFATQGKMTTSFILVPGDI